MFHHPKNMHQRGFTLIELLVVIAIIGILATIVMASLNNARISARDAQRASQVGEITKALELYYSDPSHGSYPTSGSLALGDASNLNATNGSTNPVGTALTSSGYLSRIPDDPRFQYDSSGASYVYCAGGGTPNGYVLFVNLESVDGTDESFEGDTHCYVSRGTVSSSCTDDELTGKSACTF